MKVKLLKKIRKQYVITHYPKGINLWHSFKEGEYLMIFDKDSLWVGEHLQISEHRSYKEALNLLLGSMIKRIKQEYSELGSKRRKAKNTSKKVWWNEKKK